MTLNNRVKNQDARIKINCYFEWVVAADLFNHYFLDSCPLTLDSKKTCLQ
jgi:hypothetical protein